MIVCVGDSITYGQFLGNEMLAWPHLLTGYEVAAFGVPGDTTRLGLERFAHDVQALEPDAVVIQFGHNDCNRWKSDRGLPRVSPAAYRANLGEMVERVHAFEAVPFLCTLTPSRRSLEHARDVARYDRILRDVAAETGTTLIDVRSYFTAESALMEDGLHLSAEGHRAYALAVQEALDAWSASRDTSDRARPS